MIQPPRPPDTFLGGNKKQSQQKPSSYLAQQMTQPEFSGNEQNNTGQYQEDMEQVYQTIPIIDEAGNSLHEAEQQCLSEEEQAAVARWKKRLKIVLAAVLILAVGLFLRYQVFAIRNVRILGNRFLSPQEIAKSAGLDRSLFYFTINESTIKSGINANRYLVFQKMEKIFPDTLRLEIWERKPFAFFTHLGIGYILAQDGIILEQGRDLAKGQGLIQIYGLAVWGQMSPGGLPATTDPAQIEELLMLFDELDIWSFDEEISQIDLAQPMNISLVTRDEYVINLGGVNDLHAKIGTVQSVVHTLRQRNMPKGIIEATLPGEATYLRNK